MTPHEFLRHVPKTNCGACGQPSCLAFAVAVTRGGADPRQCPQVAPAALAELGVAAVANGGLPQVEQLGRERDLALVFYLQSKIQSLDFRVIAPRLGASWQAERPDWLGIDYLAQPVALGKTAILLDGQPVADPRDQILLYNYVASCGGDEPSGDWLGLESLPNSISKVRTLAMYCETRLAARYRGRPEVLERHCRLLGGQPGEQTGGAAVVSALPVLPRVPQRLYFWDEEPDDGFEARVKVLFDRQVLHYLDLESLVFSAERMAERLCALDS
ncbi:MAG: hypothetical protein BWK76_08000 [Desulfobulbaceae bacterium A2]|nr:MAG: hypothetical protein BWK76_08000 [Desulfobulbaceae bacterium A2]